MDINVTHAGMVHLNQDKRHHQQAKRKSPKTNKDFKKIFKKRISKKAG
jgi:hypothetical protein